MIVFSRGTQRGRCWIWWQGHGRRGFDWIDPEWWPIELLLQIGRLEDDLR